MIIIILHDIILMLQIHAAVFNCFINVHHLFIIKKIIKKYNLNMTLLHILIQHVNNLTVMINI